MNKFWSEIKNRLHKKNHLERHLPKKSERADRWLLLLVIFISAIGILMVYDASVSVALRDFGNPFYFVREQTKWLFLGLLAMWAFSRIDYHIWYDLSPIMLVVTLLLLILVFIPGIGLKIYGAHRWIKFGPMVLQPAELTKLTLICYLSAWFSNNEKKRLLAFLFLLAMVVGLVIIEPDLGTATIILLTAIMLYFFSGGAIKHLLMLFPIIAIGIIILAVISPYRMSRLMTFINADHDPLGASYQVRQSLLALGSGGIFGVGIGKSRQKYEYLPEATTDSIFAILGEETGFVGTSFVIFLFLALIWRGFTIARRASDKFGRLLALGIATWIMFQAGINMSANVALLPFTGIPLPLLSYGGSSLIILLSAMGILLNISKYRN